MSVTNFLIEAPSGTGKSTLVGKLARLFCTRTGGFLTEEILEGGECVGFQVHVLDTGVTEVLAHVDFKSQIQVSRYHVNIRVIEELMIPAMSRAQSLRRLIIIDEIARMQLVSNKFRDQVKACLDSSHSVIATVHNIPNEFTDELKRREDTLVLKINKNNRDSILDYVTMSIYTVLDTRATA